MNGDIQYDLYTLSFKNGEQLETFRGRILRLQQEIILSGEIFSAKRLIFHYMKALSNSDYLGAYIAPKMIDLITFLDNNGKSAIYTGGDIHGIYRYLEMIRAPKLFTTSVQSSHHFIPSSSINNDAETLQPIIAALYMRQKSICECCGRIGHKAYTCIICGPKFLPPSLKRNMNQFNALHGDEPNEPPRKCNSQPPADHFKFRTTLSKTNPLISAIVGRLNLRSIDNGDVEVHPSEFSVESYYEYVPDPDITSIK